MMTSSGLGPYKAAALVILVIYCARFYVVEIFLNSDSIVSHQPLPYARAVKHHDLLRLHTINTSYSFTSGNVVSVNNTKVDAATTTTTTSKQGYFYSNLSAFITSHNYRTADLMALTNLTNSTSSMYYNVPVVDKVFTVLPWTRWWGQTWYVGGDGSQHYANCPFNNCKMTHNKAMLEQADAVMVHMPSIGSGFRFPAKRTANQYWIAVSRESPYTGGGANFALFNGAFNATSTYRTASEIPNPYGFYIKRTHALSTDISNINVKRPKLVAWFVSHCNVQSKRDQFTKQLQKYIPVDIYGRCGTLKCKDHGDCYKMLEREYKFYLSFENAFCADYITEKVWNILKLDIVPVVRGGGDYKAALPPGSYINVEDFSSVKALADYLLMLSKNDVMYRQYFEWKKHFEVVSGNYKAYVHCQVCAFLNRFSNVTNVVPRLDQVLGRGENCHSPNDLT